MKTVLTNGTVITGFATLKDCAVFIDDEGSIADIFNMRRFAEKNFGSDAIILDLQGSYVLPGLFDSHIHGIGGYGTEDNSPDSILGMSERLADFGVSSFLPTIYTDSLDKMIAGIKAIVSAMGHEQGAKIQGVNVEGPFISPLRIGAQNPEGVQPVNLEVFDKLIEAGQGHIICMTVAPELKHMRTLALEARKEGIVLLAGHTDATYENIIEGMQCGILHSTHFFNAMSRLHHRNPGTVGAIMIQTSMRCEIICDGVHVHPELVKLLLREKPIENIVMITDSLKPTKQRSGDLFANGVPAMLSQEGAFVSKDNPELLLGSALTLLQGIRNVKNWGISLENASLMASTNPARIYSIPKIGMILPGNKADLTILDQDLRLKGLFRDGKLIRDRFA
ncbi:MAG: N-acetylglucosamine-6-phosphate deacetylase [Spirochaetia bacterium]|jgi:N-acetylglucosamine-6-phosphate deacetylase|nr:N-acetylglucosamine-6-phosphate deacetylase [Spirochaetia bacterium]